MDDSNQTMHIPVANTPPAQVPPQPPVPQVPVTEPTGDSKKMILWLVIGLMVVVALVGGIYFFLSSQQAGNTEQPVAEKKVVQTTPPDTMDALERDLSALNIEDTENDFTSIDQDLQQL